MPALDRQGVHTIVVLIHQGGGQAHDEQYDGCNDMQGPILDLAAAMPDEVVALVSGHTHRAYNCTIGDKLVTSAASFGRLITDIELDVDRATDRTVAKRAHNVIVTRDVPPAPAETAILEHYRGFYTKLAHRVVGAITQTFSRRSSASGESALGDLIADAQLETARRIAGPDVAFAFMNPGGIRGDLTAKAGAGSDVTYEAIYNVQPFGNAVMVKTMTGDAIRRVLEQQFDASGAARVLLQVSRGLTYQYYATRPVGQHVDAATILINGARLQPARKYRVAMNEFLANGGDGFSVFLSSATAPVNCGRDLDALAAYLTAHSPVSPDPTPRIVRVH